MDAQTTPNYSLRDFLYVLFKRKNQILGFFIASVGIVTLASLLMKPTYQANAKVLVKLGREDIYTPTVLAKEQALPIFDQNREQRISSEIEILNSNLLAEQVIKSLGESRIYPELANTKTGFASLFFPFRETATATKNNALLKFKKDMWVERVVKSDVISINFRHRNSEMAAKVLNTLVNLYLDQHLQVHQNLQSSNFFMEQAQTLEKKLQEAGERLQAFKRQHSVLSPEEERKLLLRQEAALRTELNQTLSLETEATNRINELRKQLSSTPKTIPIEEGANHIPEVISPLQSRLVELEVREHEILRKYNEGNPLVQNMLKDVREETKIARQRLSEQENKLYGSKRSGLNTTYQRVQEGLLQNEAELEALKAKKEAQGNQLAEYHRKLQKLDQAELEFARLQGEVDVSRQNHKLYLTKLEESRVSNAMDLKKIANVSVVDPASPPIKPVSPKVLLNIALSIVLGALGGLGLAFLLEFLDDTLQSDKDIEHALGLPLLASIPEITNQGIRNHL